MYRDSFSEPGWMRFLRWLQASFPVGRTFGVRVRLYWIAAVLLPLILWRTAEGLPFVEGLTYVLLSCAALLVVIWSHEMGHIVAGRRYGIETPLITLSPMGGVAHMSAPAPSPRKEVVIALAGPAVHLLWLVPVGLLLLVLDRGDLRPDGWYLDPGHALLEVLLWLNGALLVFNLLPCYPMDGGRVLRGLLANRMHPNRATLIATRIGTIGGIVFIAVGIVLWIVRDDLWGVILVAIGISNLLACKQERMAARHAAGPYMTGAARQPWESDPEAWKQGGGGGEPAARSRRKEERERRRREKEAEQARQLDAEVDRILDRVAEVGMAGISAREKKILERASKRRRQP